jgi:hypothetical protein
MAATSDSSPKLPPHQGHLNRAEPLVTRFVEAINELLQAVECRLMACDSDLPLKIVTGLDAY